MNYDLFFDNFKGILYQGGFDFVPLFFKGAVKEITGYTEKDFINGEPRWDQIIHPDDLERMDIDEVRKKTDYSDDREYRIITKDKKIRWVHEIIHNIIKDGKPVLVQGYILDITERKKVEQKKKELSEITQNCADSIIKTDKNYRITYMNPAAEQLFGWTFEKACGKRPEIFHAEQTSKSAQTEIYETITSGKTYEGSFINKRKDGAKFYCEMKISPLIDEDGDIYAYIGSQRDVTDRIEAYQKLEFYKDLISHDLKNVLQNIKLSALMSEESIKSPSKRMVRMIDLVKNQVNRGIRLLSNVQTLLEVEEKSDYIQEIDIIPILKELMESIMAKNKSYSISIEGDDVTVMAGKFLSEALYNLINNAFHHNDSENPFLKIKVQLNCEQPRYCKITFTDNARGISDSIKEKVFQKGYKGKNSKRGMGLGLYLVKEIIENYKGNIRVSNRVKGDYSKGSIFSIFLPTKTKQKP
jgi:PAS domain S-box-containing protein